MDSVSERIEGVSRRVLFPFALLPAFAAGQQTNSKTSLERLETFSVKVNQRGNWLLARLTTSDGITGIGDASHGGGDAAVRDNLHQLFERLKGRSVWGLEEFRQKSFPELMEAGRRAVVAYSALEQCCWDIRGKVLNRPVCDLLGGRIHDRVRNYANINRSTEAREPEAFARLSEKAIEAGFDAVKLAPFDGMPRQNADPAKVREFTDRGVACAAAVRKAIGERPEVLIDAHSNFDLQRGLEVMRRLDPFRLYWLEEVTRGFEDLAAIRRAATIPTAGGESIFAVQGFYPYIAAGAVDIVMPDIKYCGGLLELKKIAAMAEGAGLKVSPHGPASPLGNMAAAHVCVTLPNFTILEMAFGEAPWRAEVIDPPEEVVNGHIAPSSRPGFGITLNESALRKYRAE